MKSRYELGINKLSEVDGTGGTEVVESLNDIAPDLGKYIIEFAFGDIYTRPSLDLKQRELVTLSTLAALGGCEKQLDVHINGALNVGISKKEIIEVFIQCIPYIGFPKVLNAVSAAKDVFLSRDL
ncbi:MAG: carboxymuconolactone decarboxylase family protein [Clostridium sp.]|jgi:4-carboxymuconolactone decarboxylase|uniref:carboxymuconolactone decarboxylase family protein n=1 Tax=Clostridium sp. TaxID=1506 RepID=UPI0025BDAF1D|nr:carboxymuconolactone decarboxylase family protein [Clostridium sp.]MCH3963925.1 carboxymuconolactone decarboxylase family protein [Clostridium sp.]MCI1716126.1 carboxymuconolactone decarboxylase family protein [Clostridium sp.]MCI1800634.1 carboxymuconolactone decarboxylase family protein [Clostridium sp.]MCI1814303.1 carboxymuconolactone decarboxylase family protein [Clostridium sp.]MCI1871202.1 carboxymuconolactone decarboxylase family protein [Clostridium sp.]